MTLQYITILALSIVIFLLVAALYRSLTERIKELQERIRTLEHANNFRMSYTSTREIENAQATNDRLMDLLQDAFEFAKNTHFHLSIAHNPDGKPNKKEKQS